MYDTSTDLGFIRLLIADDYGPGQLFDDLEIIGVMAREGHVKLAAATLLDAIANNEALLSKKISTQDLSTDGPAVARALRVDAIRLRAEARADVGDKSHAFEIVDMQTPSLGLTAELTERTWSYASW